MPSNLCLSSWPPHRPWRTIREAAHLYRSWARTVFAVLLLAPIMAACAALERQPAVPANLTEQATVLGIPNARFWPDTQGPALLQEAGEAIARERAAQAAAGGANGPLPPANFLAVSGGSDNGAFAAGLLVGWSDSGTRPSFKLVTGVSTGSLVAPFAFLGPAYDQQLRAVYTGIGPENVYEQRGLLSAVFNESLADTAPLFLLISRYANRDMLAAIANEYKKGRLLLIGTTDLDEQRPVIWNIGAIAASGRPEALDLVRKILLASAAVPGLFPPVLIDVEAGGRHYQEMHVDGGAVAQTFLYPPQIGTLANFRQGPLARERHAYPLRQARPRLGLGGSAPADDYGPGDLDDDPLQRLQRHPAHILDRAARRRRLQPRLYRPRFHRRAPGGFRSCLYEGTVRLWLSESAS
jgi:hypothetical protein